MHYFLFISVPGIYCHSLQKGDPCLALRPLVVHRDKFILDSNQAAKEQNVWRGMPLSEAKAILQDAQFVAWEEEPYREIQEAWLDLTCEISDVIEPCEQHSAWIDLSLQPDAETHAFKLVEQIRNHFGLSCRIGMAGTKWLAKLACETSVSISDRLMAEIALREPVVNPAAYLSPLKTSLLTPVPLEILTRLEFLGYRTIGEVARVPLNVLRGQFGDSAAHILSCARGGYFEPVSAQYPPNCVAERIAFEGLVEDLQVVDSALQELSGRVAKKLQSEDLQSKDLILTIETEEGKAVVRRKFTKPICNYPSALASLRLILNSEKQEKPLIGLRVKLEQVSPIKRVQQELTGRTPQTEKLNGIASAFQHVRTVFGDTSIQSGNEVVEPRRKQVLKAWKDATGWT